MNRTGLAALSKSSTIRAFREATHTRHAAGRRASSTTTIVNLAQMRDGALAEIAAAIAVGAPAYNAGRPDECYRTYRGAAQRIAIDAETGKNEAALLR